MPPKMTDDKLMSLAEIKRLIKKYDDLVGIDPKGKSRDELIKEIEKLGYKIDHKNKQMKRMGKKVMKLPLRVAAPPPAKKKPTKSKAEKEKDMREKVIKYIIANKDILDDERLK